MANLLFQLHTARSFCRRHLIPSKIRNAKLSAELNTMKNNKNKEKFNIKVQFT